MHGIFSANFQVFQSLWEPCWQVQKLLTGFAVKKLGAQAKKNVCVFQFGLISVLRPIQHIVGHFGRSQLSSSHCSWASLLGSLPVLSAHSFASSWYLLFLNQWKRENGCRNFFMTKSPRKNVPDVGIKLGAVCMPSGHAFDRATAPHFVFQVSAWKKIRYSWSD